MGAANRMPQFAESLLLLCNDEHSKYYLVKITAETAESPSFYVNAAKRDSSPKKAPPHHQLFTTDSRNGGMQVFGPQKVKET